MSMIQIQNLSFAYPGSYDPVFENANVQWDTAWKLGLTGRNGRGKTTLLRLLQGQYPYRGHIAATVGFEQFPCAVPGPACTVAELGQAQLGPEGAWQLPRELARMQMATGLLERPFGTLSQGEQTRVLLAVLFLRAGQTGRYLLIDEPTNHLDAAGRAQLGRYLRGQQQGFLLVSHDRTLLDECCDHMLAIQRSDITVTRGGFSTWWQEVQARDKREAAENARLAKEIGRLQEAARLNAGWSAKLEKAKFNTTNSGKAVDRGFVGAQAARQMKRAKAIEARREKAIQEKTALFKNLDYTEELKLHPLAHPKERLVWLDGVAMQYGAALVCGDVRLELCRGSRVAVQGPNGSGKSSLLRLICGEAVPHRGAVALASGLIVSYLPQSADEVRGSLEAYAARYGVDKSLFYAILRKLGLERVQLEKDGRALSAGQRKKVMLARSLCQQAHLYVWDEPLNYVDLLSRMQIEALLLEYRPTLLFVEHDRAFVAKIATQTLGLCPPATQN